MKRTLLAVTAALLAVTVPTAATATAATKRKPVKKPVKHVRTITFTYSQPCAGSIQTTVFWGPGFQNCDSTYQVTSSKTEKYMSVTIVDKTGQKVPVTFVAADNYTTDPTDIICGSATNEQIDPSTTYDLFPVVAIGNRCPVPATQGTVTVKLSNLP
jgi:hypothetical protein